MSVTSVHRKSLGQVWRRAVLIPALCAALVTTVTKVSNAAVSVVGFPANLPDKYKASGYSVTADGSSVPVYKSLSTGVGSYAYFGLQSGTATISVTRSAGFSNYVVRPLNRNVSASRNGNTITFSLSAPGNFSVEFDGDLNNPLFLFVNPPEVSPPTGPSANVIYYGPGYHVSSAGYIDVPAGKTLYIAPGALLECGTIYVAGQVKGRGVVASGAGKQAKFMVQSGSGQLLEGVIQDKATGEWGFWGCQITSSYVTVDNIKVLSNSGTDDGISVFIGHDVTIKNCFVRVKDDCVTIKGYNWDTSFPAPNTYNVTVDNCVLFNGIWGFAYRIGGETVSTELYNLTLKNSDIIHALGTQAGEGAIAIHNDNQAHVRDVLFDNLRLENIQNKVAIVRVGQGTYRPDSGRGRISRVTFNNITYNGSSRTNVYGFSPTNNVDTVKFTNFRINGVVATNAAQAQVDIGNYASNVTFGTPVTNLVSNPGFEAEQFSTQTPSGWSESSSMGGVGAGFTETTNGSKSGNYHGTHWSSTAYNIYTSQTKTGLANGLYTLRVWAKRGGNQSTCYLEAKNFGGTARTANIPTGTQTGAYQLVEIKDINVTNGQCTFGIWTVSTGGNGNGSWVYFDDFEFFKQ